MGEYGFVNVVDATPQVKIYTLKALENGTGNFIKIIKV